jgi:hypothetical protein
MTNIVRNEPNKYAGYLHGRECYSDTDPEDGSGPEFFVDVDCAVMGSVSDSVFSDGCYVGVCGSTGEADGWWR